MKTKKKTYLEMIMGALGLVMIISMIIMITADRIISLLSAINLIICMIVITFILKREGYI